MPIILPVVCLGDLFGTSSMCISRMREFADDKHEGLIKLSKHGHHKAKLADEFEFNWKTYDALIGRKSKA